jgi:hypothetical protein
MNRFLYTLFFVSILQAGWAQKPRTQFNGFGHTEYFMESTKDHSYSYFTIGEHDFFVTSSLTDKISFLGEFVIRFNDKSATGFFPSIERSFIRFNYYKNHHLIVGKIHTPVNYWNDVYHHGRVFFPAVERPVAFSHLVPLHTLGVQMQGQNLGNSNFGYDLVVGNGIASSDGFSADIAPSLTAAFHFKPKTGMRIGGSYYYNNITGNGRGAHSGHSDPRLTNYTGPVYKGNVKFHLLSASFAYFNNRYEVLNEFAYNLTKTDSLGLAQNATNYLYAGWRINDKSIPFIHIDWMQISDKDLHTYGYKVGRYAIGYRHEFTHQINLKSELEYQSADRHMQGGSHAAHNHFVFKLQLAYAF